MSLSFFSSFHSNIFLSLIESLIQFKMEILRAEETSFIVEEISEIVKETVERLIGGNEYQPEKINRWTADIVDHILTSLTNLDKPFKYIVHTVNDSMGFFFSKQFFSRCFRIGDDAEE